MWSDKPYALIGVRAGTAPGGTSRINFKQTTTPCLQLLLSLFLSFFLSFFPSYIFAFAPPPPPPPPPRSSWAGAHSSLGSTYKLSRAGAPAAATKSRAPSSL